MSKRRTRNSTWYDESFSLHTSSLFNDPSAGDELPAQVYQTQDSLPPRPSCHWHVYFTPRQTKTLIATCVSTPSSRASPAGSRASTTRTRWRWAKERSDQHSQSCTTHTRGLDGSFGHSSPERATAKDIEFQVICSVSLHSVGKLHDGIQDTHSNLTIFSKCTIGPQIQIYIVCAAHPDTFTKLPY